MKTAGDAGHLHPQLLFVSMFTNRAALQYGRTHVTKRGCTPADLSRFGCGIRIDCLACGTSRTMDGFEAVRLAGAVELVVLERRLRCSRCGERGARVAKLPPLGRR